MRQRNLVLVLTFIYALAVFGLLYHLNAGMKTSSVFSQQEQLLEDNEIAERFYKMNFEYNYLMLGLSAPDVAFESGQLSVVSYLQRTFMSPALL